MSGLLFEIICMLWFMIEHFLFVGVLTSINFDAFISLGEIPKMGFSVDINMYL